MDYSYHVELNSVDSMKVTVQIIRSDGDEVLKTYGPFTHTESGSFSPALTDLDLIEYMGESIKLVVTGAYEHDGANLSKVSETPIKSYTFYAYTAKDPLVVGVPISYPVNVEFTAEFIESPESETGSYNFEPLSLKVEWFDYDYETCTDIYLEEHSIENVSEKVTITQTGTFYQFCYNGPLGEIPAGAQSCRITIIIQDKNSGRQFTASAQFNLAFIT